MKIIKTMLTLAAFVFCTIASAQASEFPKPVGFVNDFDKVLTPENSARLNNDLVDLEKKTSIELCVVTVASLNGRNVEEYTKALANEWKVGKKDKNNGVVFLIAPKDLKMRIEIASGVRQILTDSKANYIRDQFILPKFKSGRMDLGIIDGTHEIIKVLSPPPVVENEFQNVSAPDPGPLLKSDQIQSGLIKDLSADEVKNKAVLVIFAGLLLTAVMIFFFGRWLFRSNAKNSVNQLYPALKNKLALLVEKGEHSDVTKGTRDRIWKLKSDVQKIKTPDANSDWLRLRDRLNELHYKADGLFDLIKQNISFAEKARTEGPKLMESLGSKLDEAEKKFDKGKSLGYVQQAREQYTQAQSHQSSGGMTPIDWVLLYSLLHDSDSNLSQAESNHYTSTPHSSYSSPSSSGSSSDSDTGGFSFGGGGGYDGGSSGSDSGGGGFGSDSGGSSGSW